MRAAQLAHRDTSFSRPLAAFVALRDAFCLAMLDGAALSVEGASIVGCRQAWHRGDRSVLPGARTLVVACVVAPGKLAPGLRDAVAAVGRDDGRQRVTRLRLGAALLQQASETCDDASFLTFQLLDLPLSCSAWSPANPARKVSRHPRMIPLPYQCGVPVTVVDQGKAVLDLRTGLQAMPEFSRIRREAIGS